MATFFVQMVFKLDKGILAGQVKSGILKTGMQTEINGKKMQIETMEIHHNRVNEAPEGSNVGIMLANSDYNSLQSLSGKFIEFYYFSGLGREN